MKALNTHYGGPNDVSKVVSSRADPSGKSPWESISLSSPVSSASRVERGSVSRWAVPQTRWDHIECSVHVASSDKESKILPSNDDRQKSISKNTSWAVDRTLSEATGAGRAV
jgi:hypothetical protein